MKTLETIKKGKYLMIIPLIMLVTMLQAHGDHHKKSDNNKKTSEEVSQQHIDKESVIKQVAFDANKVESELSDFPTLHPLVVHFPVVLLIFALIAQLISFLIYKNELSWVMFILLLTGVVGAWLAGNVFHPHTENLTPKMEAVLSLHEKYADYTFWLSLIALFVKATSQFILNRKMWIELIVVVVLFGSVWAVSKSGHLGAQLVHIEGVGAQGNYIEK